MKTLLIFIDGMSYSLAKSHLSILRDKKVDPFSPGIGFSNNLYPEMLAGQNPDEIGYFNEWSPKKRIGQELPILLRSFDLFRKSLYLNAGFRKIILRRFFGVDYSNIPFRYAHIFEPQGSHDFGDMTDGLLVDHKFDIFDAVDVRGPVGERDKPALDLAENNLRDKNTLISLIDIDNLAHIVGLNSKRFFEHIEMLNLRLDPIVKKFVGLNPGANVIVFSDHGMVDVTEYVSLDIERKFGTMTKDSYLYFLDATYLRIWTKDLALKRNIELYLRSQIFGAIVSEKERVEAGVTNPLFGDILFRANEGVLFAPNFYGGRKLKAMHGYDGKLESQLAFVGTVENGNTGSITPRNSKEVFALFSELLTNQNA